MSELWYLPIFIFFYMCVVFLISLKFKRYDVLDVAWGPGFILIVILGVYLRQMPIDDRSLYIILPINLWGLRLFFHTFKRNLHRAEDWRYHQWRDGTSCKHSICTFFQVFMFQAAVMMITALPLAYSLTIIVLPMFDINYFGLVLAALGLTIETIADWQRSNFLEKKENSNRLYTAGLWRFSRHPNYFGEIIFWFGLYFIAWGAPASWMLIISPLTVTYILLFVSGLPTEKKYKGRKDFTEYKRKTSALFLWFPKK